MFQKTIKNDVEIHKDSRLTPVCRAGSIRGYKAFLCRCSCGSSVEKVVSSDKLKSGKVKSCGCMVKERTIKPRIVHGKVNSPLYSVWRGIKLRCGNKNNHNYSRYGGRGIKICDSWKDDFGEFERFIMSIGWEKGLQIDRIDNDDGYHPLNVRCVTPLENIMNRPSYRGMKKEKIMKYFE